jgi:diadenosine tetraphosphate (Ap4A) HIT family hydrolase
MVIAGIEVRHVHVHLIPIEAVRDLNFERQELQPDPDRLDSDADRIRSALRASGHTDIPAS